MSCTATKLTGGPTTQTAEAGDYSGVRALLHMLQHPFDDEVGALHGCTVARWYLRVFRPHQEASHTTALLDAEVPAELCSDKFLVNTFQSKPIAAEDLQLKVT